jgi:hypothetical protein
MSSLSKVRACLQIGEFEMLANDGRSGVNKVKDETKSKPEAIGTLEESVLRMRHGMIGNEQGLAFYEKLPVNETVYRQLLELELRALQKTGRLQQMMKEKFR